MELVGMVKTYDGELHKTTEDAKRHLDILYSNRLIKIKNEMLLISHCKEALVEMAEYIDSNLGAFSELIKIKADMELTDNRHTFDTDTW